MFPEGFSIATSTSRLLDEYTIVQEEEVSISLIDEEGPV
jgi:hypothetical protein